jgi:TolB-like protein
VSARGLWVVVLPFESRSSDDASRGLADGLTEDVTTGLSRFNHLRVLSRAAAERLAKVPASTPTPGPHVSPRFAVEGTVRRSADTLRIGVRVIDTQSGANLWAESFDRDTSAGTFALQDELTGRIVATVGDHGGVVPKAIAATLADVPLEQLQIEELSIRFYAYAEQA